MENASLTRPLKTQSIAMLALLAVQYALGMAANLFVQFPETGNEGQYWQFSWAQPLVALHIIVGTLLFAGSIMLLVRANRMRDMRWQRVAGIGFASILIAWLAGTRFIGTQQDAYSYIMSIGFLAAFAAYGWGIYMSR